MITLPTTLPRQLIVYVLCAGVATIVDMTVLFGSTEWLSISYFYSAIFGYGFGMVTNYYLNKSLTFKNRSKRYGLQASLFLGVALIGLALNQLILFVFVEFLSIWYMYAKIAAVIVVGGWSFTGHKLLTFGRWTD